MFYRTQEHLQLAEKVACRATKVAFRAAGFYGNINANSRKRLPAIRKYRKNDFAGFHEHMLTSSEYDGFGLTCQIRSAPSGKLNSLSVCPFVSLAKISGLSAGHE